MQHMSVLKGGEGRGEGERDLDLLQQIGSSEDHFPLSSHRLFLLPTKMNPWSQVYRASAKRERLGADMWPCSIGESSGQLGQASGGTDTWQSYVVQDKVH